MIKVSIIIPVYNVEKYLSKCIGSVVEQTFKNIEILIINDGSTDGSSKIIEYYQNKDSRVLVVNKKNEGVSKARNQGIKMAKGKYIMFVDSDDWIEKDCVETFLEIIEEKKADIVFSQALFRVTKEDIKIDNLFGKNEKTDRVIEKSIEDYVDNIFTKINGTSVCNKIFLSSILKGKGILFKNINEVFSEDGFFNLEYSMLCSKIFCFYKAKYYYLDREGSYTNKERLWEEVIEVSLCSIDKIIHKIPDDKKFVLGYYKHFIYINIENHIRKMTKYKDINEFVNNRFITEIIKYIRFDRLTFYQKIRYLLLKYRFSLGLYGISKIQSIVNNRVEVF
ncbi:MAG: glycosyltransferase family 2 protein [Clostridiales bacterium]